MLPPPPPAPASRGTQSIYEDGVSRGVCFLLVVVSLVFTVLTRSSWLTMYGDLLLVNESILEAVVPAAQDVTGRSPAPVPVQVNTGGQGLGAQGALVGAARESAASASSPCMCA